MVSEKVEKMTLIFLLFVFVGAMLSFSTAKKVLVSTDGKYGIPYYTTRQVIMTSEGAREVNVIYVYSDFYKVGNHVYDSIGFVDLPSYTVIEPSGEKACAFNDSCYVEWDNFSILVDGSTFTPSDTIYVQKGSLYVFIAIVFGGLVLAFCLFSNEEND